MAGDGVELCSWLPVDVCEPDLGHQLRCGPAGEQQAIAGDQGGHLPGLVIGAQRRPGYHRESE